MSNSLIHPTFTRRNGQTIQNNALDFAVSRYSWHSIGGPNHAVIDVMGDITTLWELFGYLGRYCTIYGQGGIPYWWGMVHSAEIRVGVWVYSASLSDTYNRVAVAYNYVAVPTTISIPVQTSFIDDPVSQADYGTREIIVRRDFDSGASAEAFRAVYLNDYALPRITYTRQSHTPIASAKIECRGFWETLDNRYYDNPTSADVETSAQIEAIIDSGEYTRNVVVESPSSIYSNGYRDGRNSAMKEVEALMAQGDGINPYVSVVTQNRDVRVYTVSRNAIPYLLLDDGGIETFSGSAIDIRQCPVNVWARPKQMIGHGVEPAMLHNRGRIFIEESEYDVQRRWLEIRGRNERRAWTIRIDPKGG